MNRSIPLPVVVAAAVAASEIVDRLRQHAVGDCSCNDTTSRASMSCASTRGPRRSLWNGTWVTEAVYNSIAIKLNSLSPDDRAAAQFNLTTDRQETLLQPIDPNKGPEGTTKALLERRLLTSRYHPELGCSCGEMDRDVVLVLCDITLKEEDEKRSGGGRPAYLVMTGEVGLA